jgi:hypothetical protein
MKDSIRDLIEKAIPGADIPEAVSELSDDAWGAVRRYASRPCFHHLHHQRQIEKLERKRGRVPFRKVRLAHHRMWRRYWESRCEALKMCNGRGC